MNRKKAIEMVKKDGSNLGLLPKEFKRDNEIVLAAVKNYGDALEFAHDTLKKDKRIVLAAVQDDGPQERHYTPKPGDYGRRRQPGHQRGLDDRQRERHDRRHGGHGRHGGQPVAQ